MPAKRLPFHVRDLLVFLAAVFLLLLPALYNGFPLVTSDSGAYINNGYELYVPLDRPLTYSVFIRLSSLQATLWGVVAAQAVILAFLLQLLTRHFLAGHYHQYLFLGIITLISLGTSVGWFCGQLMPDIFTAILLLAVLTWYFVPLPDRWQRGLLLFFTFCVVLLHNSHVLVLLLFSAGAVLYFLLRKQKMLLRRSVAMLAVSVAGLLGFSTMNAIADKGFRPSPASHVFLMCRLVESGVMDKFLNENCAGNDYKLCAFRDQLPKRQWEFMWDENSALYKTGGWEANEAEYNRIIKKVLTTPKYLLLFCFKSGQATLRQLPQINVGDGLFPMTENSNPYWKVRQYYFSEYKEYLSSMQNTGVLSFGFFNVVIVIFTFLTGALALGIAGTRKGAQDMSWSLAFGILIAYLLCNAAVTATFSTVIGRLHSRVFWVLPFFCVLYVLQFFLSKRREQQAHP